MGYSDKLKHPLWQKKRLEILERDSFMCRACRDEETTLHIHHLKYTTKEPHEEPSENLLSLCEHCHIIYEYYKRGGVPIVSLMKLPSRSHNWNHNLYFILDGESIHLELMDLDTGIIKEVTEFHLTQLSSIEQYLKLFLHG